MTSTQPYPDIEPYRTGFLPVSAVHTLYYEESGNPEGKPIVFLHGGPGGSSHPKARKYFDPAFYRIILFDQRGAGKSTPALCLDENTTWHLVEDLEKLRLHLGIQQWVVFGGSWGSTLALAYAITYPEAVLGLIMRGIFLGRKMETDWLYQHGASMIHPEEWQDFISPIPQEERHDFISAYHKRFQTLDGTEQYKYAKIWSDWEDANSFHLKPEASLDEEIATEETKRLAEKSTLAVALIEAHYFMNHCFFEQETYLLDHIAKILHIPCRMVQGRYDMVCPPRTAWELKQYYPNAELILVPDGGHAGSVGAMSIELVRATEDFKKVYP
jgi:proline iminopeptidase